MPPLHPADIFSFDGTGRFYRAESRSPAANGPVKGTKISKERITFALCTNANGTEQLKALVIGNARQPPCFKDFDHEDLWYSIGQDKIAWMTQSLFQEYFLAFNQSMLLSGR